MRGQAEGAHALKRRERKGEIDAKRKKKKMRRQRLRRDPLPRELEVHMEDTRQGDHMDEGGGKEITEMPAEHINGENAQRDMSISEFMQYIKTVKRVAQREIYERMACWRGVLVSVEGELWGDDGAE